MNHTTYRYGNTPFIVPIDREDQLCGGEQLDHGPLDRDRLVKGCGERTDDSEIAVTCLTESWNGHRAGDLVVTGLDVEGHTFHVVPYENAPISAS